MAVLFLFFGIVFDKSASLPSSVPQVSLSSSTFTFCQFLCNLFLIFLLFLFLKFRGREKKKRTQTLELLRGVWCSLKHQFIDQRSSQFDLLFFLLFPFLFCHFSLVCGHDTTSCLYRATCSFEHTATYWQRGILPLKSHKEELFRWSQISFGFIPEG